MLHDLLSSAKKWLGIHSPAIMVCPLPQLDWSILSEGVELTYCGYYYVYDKLGQPVRMFAGRIVIWTRMPAEVYMADVPPEVMRHPHGPCWQLVAPGGRWSKLHWTKPPSDFDTARAYVESMLAEVYKPYADI